MEVLPPYKSYKHPEEGLERGKGYMEGRTSYLHIKGFLHKLGY